MLEVPVLFMSTYHIPHDVYLRDAKQIVFAEQIILISGDLSSTTNAPLFSVRPIDGRFSAKSPPFLPTI